MFHPPRKHLYRIHKLENVKDCTAKNIISCYSLSVYIYILVKFAKTKQDFLFDVLKLLSWQIIINHKATHKSINQFQNVWLAVPHDMVHWVATWSGNLDVAGHIQSAEWYLTAALTCSRASWNQQGNVAKHDWLTRARRGRMFHVLRLSDLSVFIGQTDFKKKIKNIFNI